MSKENKKNSPRSVKGKVLGGFSLAFLAMVLAFLISRYAFNDILTTVDELASPNEKLSRLNSLFQKISMLDQLQRAEAIRNPKRAPNAFLNHSQETVILIDSMLALDWRPEQRERIASMKEILQDRDSLFFSYLKQKSSLMENPGLTRRIDTLSHIIEQKKVEIDSSVITTEKKTTTTFHRDTLEKQKDERNFLSKVFGRKKRNEPPDSPNVEVTEEVRVVVDTIAIAKQNKALEEVEKIVNDLEKDHRRQSKRLMARELELINANNLLIRQLMGILRQVESEEVESVQLKNANAGKVVSESIRRISLLLLVFFPVSAILVYLIWHDIRRSNFYKEQLEKARDEAEHLSQVKQRFLANMSHEIRTPLQSILGFSEHVRKEKNPDRQALEAIHTSSEHLLHIVNEVLDYSRISSGKLTLAKEDFDLLLVVREVESAMRIQAEQKKLTLLIDVEQVEDYRMKGDPFRLRQILYNVLGNAVKFTSAGYVRLSVKTRTAAKDKAVTECDFSVQDTGIGIEPEDLQRIFNQFEQADTSITRKYGGTGLGLTIVKSLVDAQGGTFSVESKPGEGSTFSIYLPFEKSDSTPQEKPAAITYASSPVECKKVLVVDDDPMILSLCGVILNRNGIEHELFNDPRILQEREPSQDVTHILLDLRMPGINGLDLCRRLRRIYPTRTIFIALTAHVFQQEKSLVYSHGFDEVLTKPFHEEELIALLGKRTAPVSISAEKRSNTAPDLEPLRKMTMYDDTLFNSILQQFVGETNHELHQLQYQVEVGDLPGIREVIHKIAGRTSQIGVHDLAAKLRRAEVRIESGETFETMKTEVTSLKKEIAGLITSLTGTYLEKSNG